MPLDLTALGTSLDRLDSVEASVEKVIDDLMAEVASLKNDPVALQAMVDRVNANSDKLAAKAANTSGAPVTPPIPNA
jgi:peptidoglycan hydrolase CwlO-like protein